MIFNRIIRSQIIEVIKEFLSLLIKRIVVLLKIMIIKVTSIDSKTKIYLKEVVAKEWGEAQEIEVLILKLSLKLNKTSQVKLKPINNKVFRNSLNNSNNRRKEKSIH